MQRARSIAILSALAATGGLLLTGSAPGADDTPVPSASAPIAVGIDSGGGPYVTTYDPQGQSSGGFLPYDDFTQGGINVATGDVTGDGKAEIVTVPGQGGRAEIRVFDASGKQQDGPTPLATATGCGARIAVGDVTGDKKADFITGADRCDPDVQVFDGTTGKRIARFQAYSGGNGGGVRVAAGDVNGDGRAEIVTGAGPGDAPTVRIFTGTPSESNPTPLRSFDAFGSSVTTGLEVAAADVNGDGKDDVIVGAETPDDPQIKIFDGATGTLLDSFKPFGLVAAGTLRLAAGDLDGDGKPEIVVGATLNYAPTVKVFEPDGTKVAEFYAPLYNGRSLAIGDFAGDGKGQIVMSEGPSYDSAVSVFDTTGTASAWFEAYGYSFTNGVRVAMGDLEGNGALEYVTGQGAYGHSELLVLDREGNVLHELYPFGDTWQGLYVASGDVDGNGKADIVAGAGQWEEPRIKVYDGQGTEKASFLAFDQSFQGGVRVATGDLNGDGKAEIIAGAGPGGPPVVRVFDQNGQRELSFYAFDSSYTGGVYVASGDLDGDGKAEIVVGSGTTGDVRVFDADGHLRTTFQAYQPDPNYYDGTHVAVGDVNGDGTAEIVTGPGRVRPVDVEVFRGDGQLLGSFRANADFQGGVYVAVPAPLGPRLVSPTAYPVNGRQGRALRLVASFTDPRGSVAPQKFAATISWGDDTTSQGTVAGLGAGQYGINATHTYWNFGRYPISVQIADTHLRGAIARTTATIQDARISVRGRTIRTKGLVFEGTIAVAQDEDPSESALNLHVIVDWGDGKRSSASPLDLFGGRFRLVARHRYGRPAVYRAVIRVRTAGGSKAQTTSTIRVDR